jgi:CheY-like chemotaxis protein
MGRQNSLPRSGLIKTIAHHLRRGQAETLLSVLIVDDEAPVRQFVQRVLSNAGMTTWTAANGLDAARVFSTIEHLDLLLTDLQMPGLAGDELARRLRREEPNLKVLYLTGFSDRLFAERQLLWEAEAFLDKPCTVAALLEAVSMASCGQTASSIAKRTHRMRRRVGLNGYTR